MDIKFIRQAVSLERYEISQHAERERRNDGLNLADIENAVRTGEVIEDYPDDQRGASCLVFGWAHDGRPVHLVVGFLLREWIRIITVYVPNPVKWEPDWKTRKRGQEQ
ncbi:MAG: DUF4258 domain-containing protein [Bacillota bacterium]